MKLFTPIHLYTSEGMFQVHEALSSFSPVIPQATTHSTAPPLSGPMSCLFSPTQDDPVSLFC